MCRYYDCVYFITNPDGNLCLMKRDFCILGWGNVDPKKCSNFKKVI